MPSCCLHCGRPTKDDATLCDECSDNHDGCLVCEPYEEDDVHELAEEAA